MPRHSASQYARLKQFLLAPGKAFNRIVGSDLTALIEGLCEEFDRLDQRATDIIEEAYPNTTTELLPDYERVFALPDSCIDQEQSIAERRVALVEKMTYTGEATPASIEAGAAALGFDIEVIEYKPFQCGVSVCGDPLSNDDWIYCITVAADEFTETAFICGGSQCGDPLRKVVNEVLECYIASIIPAHVCVIFTFG